MKKKLCTIFLIFCVALTLCACTKDEDNESTFQSGDVDVFNDWGNDSNEEDYHQSEDSNLPPFSIHFIDVGQGDAALVQCEGHYMLIDGGDFNHGQDVYDALCEAQGLESLDILAISHLHEDHYGGLTKALSALSGSNPIGLTISNSYYVDNQSFRKFEHELYECGSRITVPEIGEMSFEFGDATIEVVDVTAEEKNDSLVLLITYGKTRFLFTGDIQKNGQKRVAEYLSETSQNDFKGESLIKMPHHGAYNDDDGVHDNNLNRLLTEYDPTYFIISVGENNIYDHPHSKTIELLEQYIFKYRNWKWDKHVFRTDKQGDIYVRSDGKNIIVEVE